MNKRSVRIGTAAGVAAMITGAAATEPQPDRPNIVFILADDLDFDGVGFYELENMPSSTGAYLAGVQHERLVAGRVHTNGVVTPTLDRLAREGTRLDRFYITSPVCNPSRYSFMTGQYASRAASYKEKYPVESEMVCLRWDAYPQPGSGRLLPDLLRQNGYATGMVGKWHLTDYGVYEGNFKGFRHDADYDDMVIQKEIRRQYAGQVRFMKENYGWDYADRILMTNPHGLNLPGIYNEEKNINNLEWLVEGARDFISAHASREPFFLYVALTVPHATLKQGFVDGDPTVTPAGRLDAPPQSGMPPRATTVARAKAGGAEPCSAMATWIDDSVAAVIDRLAVEGVLDNTLIIFSSDHQYRGKYTVYEAARVPTLVWGPKWIPAGRRNGVLSANIDLAPTLLSAAGIEPPENVKFDGTDLWPVWRGLSNDPVRENLLLEINYMRAVVTQDNWKYVAVRMPLSLENMLKGAYLWGRHTWDGEQNTIWLDTGPTKGARYEAAYCFPAYYDKDQLYNLRADPYEHSNLYANPEYRSRMEELHNELSELLKQLPHPCAEFTE